MKSKRALDISTLPPIENLKIGSFGYRRPEPLFKYGPVIHKGIICVISWRGRAVFNTAAIIILYQGDRAS